MTGRLWKRASKTRALVARGITPRPFWFSRFRPGYEVRDFSKAYRLSPKVCFRHREPQSGEKLKARVARVRRDFGPLVQNAGQAQGKDGNDPFAPLLARKIRYRLIRHRISHRVGKVCADDDSAHSGYVCRWGEIGSGDLRSDPPPRQHTIAIEEARKPIVAMLLIPPRQRT